MRNLSQQLSGLEDQSRRPLCRAGRDRAETANRIYGRLDRLRRLRYSRVI